MLVTSVCPAPTDNTIYRLDQFEIGRRNTAEWSTRWPSGEGIEAARAVVSIGHDSTVVGFIGRDCSLEVQDLLRSFNIDPALVETAISTRRSVTVVSNGEPKVTTIMAPTTGGEVDSTDVFRLKKLFLTSITDARALILAGDVPRGIDEYFYAELTKLARATRGPDFPIIIDAEGPLLMNALKHRPTVVKPNREEMLRSYNVSTGQDTPEASVEAMAKDLVSQGACYAVVSSGAESVILANGSFKVQRFSPPKLAGIQNPFGSGGSLAAGLAVYLAQGERVPNAIRYGIALASANADSPFTGQIPSERVRELYEAQTLVPVENN